MSTLWSEQDVEIAAGLHESGIPLEDIANLLGRTVRAVESKLRLVEKFVSPRKPGEWDYSAGGTNLTDKQWKESCRIASEQYTAALLRLAA